MTHEDAGKYSNKHRSGTIFNEQVARMVREKSPGGELACVTGEKISKELEVVKSGTLLTKLNNSKRQVNGVRPSRKTAGRHN